MKTLLISLMVTWTDIFNGIGEFSYWCFKGLRALGQFPNVFFGAFVIFGIAYWCMRIQKYKGISKREGTVE
jgi:hypothetical protein